MLHKNLLFLFLISCLMCSLTAQEKYNNWFVDGGVGTAWQTSTVKHFKPGTALHLGMGKWFLQNSTRPVDIAFHLRYMTTHTYGYDVMYNNLACVLEFKLFIL